MQFKKIVGYLKKFESMISRKFFIVKRKPLQ